MEDRVNLLIRKDRIVRPMETAFSQAPVFEGCEDRLSAFLSALSADHYYTYLLLDPSGTPFYVGKGKSRRVLEHKLEAMRDSLIIKTNPFKCRKIRGILKSGNSLSYRIDQIFGPESEQACLKREEALIAHYLRRCDGGVLTNLAAGLGSLSARDPHSAMRHAATLSGVDPQRPERTALNLFLKSLGGIDSVPIKPLSEYRSRLVAAYPSPKNLKTASRRNGLTVAGAVLASGKRLTAGRPIPRVFQYYPDPQDWPLEQPAPSMITAVIENGAMSDLLKLGLATLIPGDTPHDEAIVLDDNQIRKICELIGHRLVEDWQLLVEQ